MLRFLPGHRWQWEPSTISLLTRCFLVLQAAASWVDERIGKGRGKKRENFSLRKINRETWKQNGQQTEQDLGLMELLGPRWLSECKASSLNLSECSIKPLFYKTKAKILGESQPKWKYPSNIQASFQSKAKKPNGTVREVELDMSALHTACQRPTTPEAWARP